MTAAKWDDLPEDWSVRAVPQTPDVIADDGTQWVSGAATLRHMLECDAVWRKLTKPQRELLLSAVAGYPVAPRRDVLVRMIDRGLVDKYLNPTDAGKLVVKWRLP